MRPFHAIPILACLLAATLFVGSVAAAPPNKPAQADVSTEDAAARVHFEQGVARFDQQAYREALEEFRKSLAKKKTRNAMGYAASCLKQLGQYEDALDQYEQMRLEYPTLPPKTEATVTADMAELRGLVGTLVLAGDVPAGASLLVDDRLGGKLPLDAPLRLSAGSRALRIEKEGFDPITMTVEVKAGKENTAQLMAKSRKGRLRVTERHNWPLAVEIDGKDTGGVTPWEGLVDPGEHTVRLRGTLDAEALLSCEVPGFAPGEKKEPSPRGAKMESPEQTASVRLYDVTEVVLGAEDQDASLKIEASPAGAKLLIDGKEVGQAPWEGRLALGDHIIEVRAKGYFGAKQGVKLERRRQREVTVALEREPDLAALQTAKNLRNTTAAASYGVGVAGLGLGAVTSILALQESSQLRDRCGGPSCPIAERPSVDNVRTLTSLSTAGFVVAGVGALAGTAFLFTLGPRTPAPPHGDSKGAARSTDGTWRVSVGIGQIGLEGSF